MACDDTSKSLGFFFFFLHFLCLRLVGDILNRQGNIFRFQFFRKKISLDEIQAKMSQAKPNQGIHLITAMFGWCVKCHWKSCEGLGHSYGRGDQEGLLEQVVWVVRGAGQQCKCPASKMYWFYSKVHPSILENFEDNITQASFKAPVPFIIYLKFLVVFFLVRDMNLKEFQSPDDNFLD